MVVFHPGEAIVPLSPSRYVFLGAWLALATVLSYAYASGLISALTLPAKARTVDTFEQLVAASDYSVALKRGGFILNYIKVD